MITRSVRVIGEFVRAPNGAQRLVDHGPESKVLFMHRGGWSHTNEAQRLPENSMANFHHAERAGVDGIELDVHASRDGRLVVNHDRDVHGVDIAKTDYLNLPRLHNGERPPLLDQVFEQFRHKLLFNVETKVSGVEAAIAKAAQDHKITPDELLLISFLENSVSSLRPLFPNNPLLLLHKGSPDEVLKRVRAARAVGANAIGPPADMVTPSFVAQAREQGMDVVPWSRMAEDDVRRIAVQGTNPALPAATVNRTDVAGAWRAANGGVPAPHGADSTARAQGARSNDVG